MENSKMTELYDVVEVSMDGAHKVEVLDVLLGWKQADVAVKRMAAARQGSPHFFKAVPAGTYRDGQPFRF
jgi:hypothetical protein